MTMAGQILAALAALLVIFLGGGQFAGPHLGKYKIADNSIEYTMFGRLRVWEASFDDISEIQIISFSRLWVTPSLRLMNRPFAKYVLIRKRSGIFKAVVITPDNPEEFVRLVQQRIRHIV